MYVRFKGAHTPSAPPAGFLHSQKTRENLNPFVYQESAGRANPHNRYWNPGNATELPRFPSRSKYTRGSKNMPDLEPRTSDLGHGIFSLRVQGLRSGV
jgi:hypothetical protein